MAFIAVLLFVAGLFLLWGFFSPQTYWLAIKRWQYRDPEANEPSDAGFTAIRVSSLLSATLSIGCGVYLLTIPSEVTVENENDSDVQQQEQKYQDCLTENADKSAETDGFMTAEEFCKLYSPAPKSGE